jgi:hypothetical protein
MTDDSTENHLAIEVYRDVSENIRLYARQRFTLLTIFVAVTGGLLAVAYTKGRNRCPGNVRI